MRKRLTRIVGKLWRLLTVVLLACWRFIGRMGLATRRVLTLLVWKPLVFFTFPIWLPLRWLFWDYMKEVAPPIWRFMGQVGQAVRRMLTRLIWRPIHKLIITPVVWYWRHFVCPMLRWLRRQIRRMWLWLLARTAVRRALWRRRYRSRWLVRWSRWRLAFKRPSPPEKAEVAPARPYLAAYSRHTRRVRLATAVAAISLLLVVALLSLQERPGTAVADTAAITIILTPTPLPPTPTPVPTVAIRLTPWATPDPTTRGGLIAFAQTVDGNSDIYVLPVGQAEPVRLTTHVAADRDPAWSPDGTQIAFSSRRDDSWDIYVYDVLTGRMQRVTRSPAYDGKPAWSPDGQWLAYESYRDNNLDIYVVRADGREGPYRLTYDPAPDFNPAWSPGGRHIAFTSWRTGNQEIFIQSLDDTTGETVVNVTNTPGVQEDGAAFSPDGRMLAYQDDSAGFLAVMGQPLNERNEPDGPPVSLGHQGRQVAWSPDSQSLVYVHEKDGRSYLVAGSVAAWGIAPQVYAAAGPLDRPSWVAVDLSPDLTESLRHIDGRPADKPLFVEAVARPERGRPPVTLFELPVSAPSPYLSDQVDQSFAALRERVIDEAGWDFLGQLDGMFEPLTARPLPGQSVESWSKAGRAFDVAYRRALGLDPQVMVVREDVGAQTYWRLYVRTAVQDGSLGEPMTSRHWNFQARSGDDPQYYEQGGKLADSVPAGYYIDFTALAAAYGWERVPANSRWRTYFPDILFWRFENRQSLTWLEAMQQLYTEAELSGNP